MGIIESMESRSSSLPELADWIREALSGGSSTRAGMQVKQKNALGITAYWNGVQVISQTVASLPCEAFERIDSGRRPARHHRVHHLLHERPNDHMSPFTFKEIRQAHLLTWGNSYAEIEVDATGRPAALWPLLPDRTGVEVRNGRKFYWTMINGVRIWLNGDRVLHTPGLGYDGLSGYNPITMHRESLGLTLAASQYGAEFFRNSGRPSGILTHPGNPGNDERQQFRDEWNQVHSGLTNAQRTAVLWGGMDWTQISIPPNDAQFLETRSHQIDEVARILNINPILLQKTEGATTWGTAIGQFLVAFAKFTIQPWLERDEDALNWTLFPQQDRGRYYVKYNQAALLRGDPEVQARVLEIELRNGVTSPDEWRELTERNPLPQRQGETHFVPLNMQPLKRFAPEDDDEAPSEDVEATALNGAQIASLLDILNQVTAKLISPEAAKVALQVSFPLLSTEQIDQMVDAAADFERPPEVEDLRSHGVREQSEAAGVSERRAREERSLTARRRLREAHLASFEDGARRVTRREVQALKRAITRAFESENPAHSLNRWIEDFYPDQERVIQQTMFPLVTALATAVAAEATDEVGADPVEIEQFANEYSENLARREAGASRGQILSLLSALAGDELREELTQRADEWSETRPAKVAQNEVVRVSSGASRHAYQESGVVELVWRANPGACPLCLELDGNRVAVSQPFLDSGDTVNPGGGTSPLQTDERIGGPPLHQGCQCDLVAG